MTIVPLRPARVLMNFSLRSPFMSVGRNTVSSHNLVQPIVLLVDKEDPAPQVDGIHAAALASVLAYVEETHSGSVPAEWKTWLDGKFTKTVRRADAKTFEKLERTVSEEDHASVQVGRARALAFKPMSYEQMPKHLSRLQVSGTTLPAHPTQNPVPARKGVPVVVLNGSLDMSTGKASAQAAHALFAWYLTLENHVRASWYVPGCEFQIETVDADDFASQLADAVPGSVIVDSGLTEIEPNTTTAFVRRAV